MIRKAVPLFVLAAALAAPGLASAGVPASYPAAGPVVVGKLIVRAKPSSGSRKLMVMHDYRDDGLRQYVLAVSGRRVGYLAALRAKLILKNTSGDNALVLVARKAGAAGNNLSAAVLDELSSSDPESGQDFLVILSGTSTLATIGFPVNDLATLATTVNGMSLPLTASAKAAGPLAITAARHLAGGRAGKAGRYWLRIVVPKRPLGRKGWIRDYTARVKPTQKRIVVDRTTHWLSVFNGNRRVFRTRVATGRPDRPTPRGLFYVAAKYRPPEGPLVTAFALELSAPAGLPDFLAGGVVGIHGTPATYTLGHNASNGCIRVTASAVLRLKKIIPVGTPVRVIR